ncbi:MAG: N-acetyltransferase [Gammaproteobacteria bacterium]|nr:N-acetyltransferase [Gammaproteobacteria bacterium]
MIIRPAEPQDLTAVLRVERAAFGRAEEAELVAALLEDPTASPRVSLLAEVDGAPVGHVLFTGARVQGEGPVLAGSLLAPLAVVPAAQRRGVGLALIRAGLAAVAALDAGLVFVLGHPSYYPRAGFRPALPLGLRAPYAIDSAVADAWMVCETRPGLLGAVRGTVGCADALMNPVLWRE